MEANIEKMRQVIQEVTLRTATTMETVKKWLTCQVPAAAVRLHAVARDILARRRVRWVLDLQ
jgi:hypothetical protein